MIRAIITLKKCADTTNYSQINYIYIYIYNRTLAKWLECSFANGLGGWGPNPGRVMPKTQKWYLIPPCFRLSIIRYGTRVKWINPRKGVAPFLTPWYCIYRKGSLRVTLDYGRQQLYIYIYI